MLIPNTTSENVCGKPRISVAVENYKLVPSTAVVCFLSTRPQRRRARLQSSRVALRSTYWELPEIGVRALRPVALCYGRTYVAVR